MRKIIHLLLLLVIFLPVHTAAAQDPTPPSGPIYIVQSGDTLTSIAVRFGISSDELIAANQIADPNSLKIGDQLIIPGLEGIQGYLVTETVGFGSSLNQLTAMNKVSRERLIQLNRITSPAELYAGVNLIIPEPAENTAPTRHYLLSAGQSTLEFAVQAGISPWALQQVNQLQASWDALPGDTLYLPAGTETAAAGLQTNPLDNISISPLPLAQGKTITISVQTGQPATINGTLTGRALSFQPNGENRYVSLQGINGMQEPGIYPLHIDVAQQDGTTISYEQMVLINSGYYPNDPVINVKDEFIDPTITTPELEWLVQQVTPVTAEKYWDGMWIPPSPYTDCYNSRYGNRRSYNGGPYENFHTGLDFCGGDGVKIFAPARGKVIFAGSLTVRGNATIIDHGWGIYSGYWHQAAIEVAVGDMVEAGQEIGLVGGTGRVTGAHLHWEIWVNGNQIDPEDWLRNTYPAE